MYLVITLFVEYMNIANRIGDVMASVLASSAVDRGFEPRSSQTEDYTIGFRMFLR